MTDEHNTDPEYGSAKNTRAKITDRVWQMANEFREVFWVGTADASEIYYMSPAYEEVWGRSCQSVYDDPQSRLDAIHEEDRPAVRVAIAKKGKVESEQTVSLEYRIVRPCGTVRWILERAHPFQDGKEQVVCVACVAEDVTERKLAELACREYEEQLLQVEDVLLKTKEFLSAVYNSSDMSIFVVNVTEPGDYIYEGINPVHEKLTGVTNADISGKSTDALLDRFGAETVQYIKGLYDDCVAKRQTLESEFLVSEGEAKGWWYSKLTPLVDPVSGRVVRLLGSSVMITALKETELKLKQSEEKLRSYFDAAPHGISIVDAEGRYVEVNQSMFHLTGYTEAELKEMTIFDRIESDTLTEHERAFETLKKTGRMQLEYKTRRKDGANIWISLHAVALTPDRFMGFGSDITETKRLQQLESRASRLETAGTIAGQVAHDFNNLLGPLLAYPEFIRDTLPRNHSCLGYLDRIEQAARRMADINQDLMVVSRRGHYNQRALNLNTIVQQAWDELKPHSPTLTCELALDSELLDIHGGSAQLHRMISNLLHNARDAMQDVGRIAIKTENCYIDEVSFVYNRVPKGEYVRLAVSDTGCGIPDSIVQNIFDPFFTTKTADRKRGSGLGMTVVDAVVRDHNGHVDLNTRVGQGTSFYIYLPIARQSERHGAQAEIQTGQENVLVVDDDEVQREVSVQMLEKLGYSAQSMPSGEKAVQYLRHNPRDLIILDMVMPGGMDGTETLKHILQLYPRQKVLIVSGFAESERVLEAQKLGAGDYVRKPVTRTVLASAVRKELDRPL